MSAGGASTGSATGGGRTAGVVVVGVVVVLLALVLVGSPGRSEPLDPRSHDEQGTSALMALLAELGAEVTLDVRVDDLGTDPAASESFDVVLVLRDLMDDSTRGSLGPWVNAGGTLVVADPRSPLAPLHSGIAPGSPADDPVGRPEEPVSARDRRYGDLDRLADEPPVVSRDVCTIEELAEVDAGSLLVEGRDFRYPVASESQSCFGDEGDAFVVARSRGDGTQISLGSAGVLTNEALANQPSRDNAVLLAALLAPTEGARVGILDASARQVDGEESLVDLIPTWVKLAAAQLIVALVVFALWRARRLGRPVAEPQPVKVASSELVAAVGGLLQRTGSPQHAAEVLRADLRRDLNVRFGLAPDLPPERFFQVVAARVTLDPADLHRALGPGPVPSDLELLAVTRTIDAVRKEVLDSVGTGS